MSEVGTTDLRGRAAPAKMHFGATGKILGAVLVLIGATGVGLYAYQTRPAPHHKQAVSMSQLPEAPASSQQP